MCITFLVYDPFCSSIGPLDHRSPFHILLVLHSISPFGIIPSLIFFSHWLSDVEAYPESYLEPRFPLHSVLYKVTQPLVCSLASSTQFSLVSSLPRFALRNLLYKKPSLNQNGSLRTLRLFVRSSLGYSTLREPYLAEDYFKDTLCMLKITGTTLSARIRLEITL